MSNDSTPVRPQLQPTLPRFDPADDERRVLPSAPTAPTPIVPPSSPYTYAAAQPALAVRPAPTGQPAPVLAEPAEVHVVPAGRAPRWSAKKTAITAGLALVLTSAGAIGAAAAMPSGSTADNGRFGGGQGRTLPGPLGGQRLS